MRLANIFKQSSVYLAGDVLRRSIGFLMIPVYTHYLTPSDYGIIELIELFVMIAGVCFGLGAISDGMVRVYHEVSEENRTRVVSTTMIAVALLGLVIAASAMLAAGQLSLRLFGTRQYEALIRMSFMAMLFTGVIDAALTYQRIRLRAVFFVSYAAVQLLANVGLNIYFIVIAGRGVWGFILAKLICTAIGAAFLLVVVFREIGWGFGREEAIRIARFAGPLIPSGGAFFVIHFSDRFFLNHYTTLSAVGIYALAYKFGFLVTYLVGQPFGSVWSVSLYSQVSGSEWRSHFARVASYLVFMLVLVALCLGLFADKVMALVAMPAYAPAAALIGVIAFGYVFREVGDFFRGVLFLEKRVKLFGNITVAAAIFNLLLEWALISRYAAAGAAWATLLTWLFYMIGCWIYAHREHAIPYPARSLVLVCLGALLVLIAATKLHTLPIVWQWGGCGLLVLAFLAFNWIVGYFDPHERKLILQELEARRIALTAGGRSR